MAGDVVDPDKVFKKPRDRRTAQLTLVIFVIVSVALVELVVSHPSWLSVLSESKEQKREREEAEAKARLVAQGQAEQKKKEQAQAGFNHADMLFGVAQYDECCKEFEQAIKIYSAAPYLTHIRYMCSCAYLRRGQAAGASAERFLNTFGWTKADGQLDWSAYAVLYGYTGYRQAGNGSAAKRLIDEGVAKCNTKRWPYPLLACLHGEMDTSALFSLAGNDQWKATDASTFIGIQSLYDGNERNAMAHFAWAVENGRKDALDFALAMSELRRLTKFKNSKSQTEQAQSPMPSEADKATAQAGFNRTEMFWKTAEYDKVCDEFERAFSLYPVPPYSTLCDYIVACACVKRGETAGRFGELSLAAFGWQRPLSAYHVLYGYTGYRQAGNTSAAQQLLDKAALKCNPAAWPYPIIAYLRGEIDASAVFDRAGNNQLWNTEARTFVGVKQLYDGNGTEGSENLAWVKQRGNKNDLAYVLASSEMDHISLREESPIPVQQPLVQQPLVQQPPVQQPPVQQPPSVPISTNVPPVETQRQINNDAVQVILEHAAQGKVLQISEILTLASAGLSDDLIMDKIRESRAVYKLNADEVIELKQAGLSEKAIDCILQTLPRLALSISALDGRKKTVTVSGTYSGPRSTTFIWDWGDGTRGQGGVFNTHTYPGATRVRIPISPVPGMPQIPNPSISINDIRDYTIKVTANYGDGRTEAEIRVHFP